MIFRHIRAFLLSLIVLQLMACSKETTDLTGVTYDSSNDPPGEQLDIINVDIKQCDDSSHFVGRSNFFIAPRLYTYSPDGKYSDTSITIDVNNDSYRDFVYERNSFQGNYFKNYSYKTAIKSYSKSNFLGVFSHPFQRGDIITRSIEWTDEAVADKSAPFGQSPYSAWQFIFHHFSPPNILSDTFYVPIMIDGYLGWIGVEMSSQRNHGTYWETYLDCDADTLYAGVR